MNHVKDETSGDRTCKPTGQPALSDLSPVLGPIPAPNAPAVVLDIKLRWDCESDSVSDEVRKEVKRTRFTWPGEAEGECELLDDMDASIS